MYRYCKPTIQKSILTTFWNPVLPENLQPERKQKKIN